MAFCWSGLVSLAMAAEKLKDLSQPIDVPLLDATVAAFYDTRSKEEVPFPVSSSFYFFSVWLIREVMLFVVFRYFLLCTSD